jgi:hypothetical protein
LKLPRAPFCCLRRTEQRESHGRLVTNVAVGPRAASAVSASSVSARSTWRRCDDPSFSGTGQAHARTALSLRSVTAGVFEEVWRTAHRSQEVTRRTAQNRGGATGREVYFGSPDEQRPQLGMIYPDLGLYWERVTGIEPALSAWEADVLPLNYTREPPPGGDRCDGSYPIIGRVRRGVRGSGPGARSGPRGGHARLPLADWNVLP